MSEMSNKQLGNLFEKEFCEILADNRYWVLNIPQTQAGQPADVIAVKDGKAHLIDCKYCSGDSFVLNRVEDNQTLSMKLWNACGNFSSWFAVKIKDEIHMISSTVVEAIKADCKAINYEAMEYVGEELATWLMANDN